MSAEMVREMSNGRAYFNFFNASIVYGEKVLYPCEPISDYCLSLIIVDKNNFNPDRLQISDRDRDPIRVSLANGDFTELVHPGKSAIIVTMPEVCLNDIKPDIVKTMVSEDVRRSHHFHIASVSEVYDAGWIPFYTPLQLERKIPHARIVARTTMMRGSDPTENDIQKLANAFKRLI